MEEDYWNEDDLIEEDILHHEEEEEPSFSEYYEEDEEAAVRKNESAKSVNEEKSNDEPTDPITHDGMDMASVNPSLEDTETEIIASTTSLADHQDNFLYGSPNRCVHLFPFLKLSENVRHESINDFFCIFLKIMELTKKLSLVAKFTCARTYIEMDCFHGGINR